MTNVMPPHPLTPKQNKTKMNSFEMMSDNL